MQNLLFMGLGGQELIIILIIVLLLFGAKKIPELMRGAGQGVRAFKDGMKEMETAVKDEPKADQKPEETAQA
ncbi:MAG: twin-arginine translocase TatA/TatE family subunit [Bacteroidaceae bacterium]|nr:twin-arginine translocase TatA/TatE family subunit [Bacteroidaceae bacterium]